MYLVSKPKFLNLPFIRSLSSPKSIWSTLLVLNPSAFLVASNPKKLKLKFEFEETKDLPDTLRGSGGFGSTGKKWT